MGSLYRRGSVWWAKYRLGGRTVRESLGTDDSEEARRLLAAKEGSPTPLRAAVTFDDLVGLLIGDYKANGKRTLDAVERRLRLHVLPVFGRMRAARITTTDADRYIRLRERQGAKPATINRELAIVRRALNLGRQRELLKVVPYIPTLRENNVRQGFVSWPQLEQLVACLPSRYRGLVLTLFLTGWRKQEVLGLRWPEVHFDLGEIRLTPDRDKGKDGRVFPITDALAVILQRQRAKAVEGCLFVFHRNGKPVRGLRKVWAKAAKEAGLDGLLIHDLRRSAYRALRESGVRQEVVMKLLGHKTDSMAKRYAIVAPGDLRELRDRLQGTPGHSALDSIKKSIA
jgi:integrase